MSDWSNPFAEDAATADPFSDPSVQSATAATPSAMTTAVVEVDDYNPFAAMATAPAPVVKQTATPQAFASNQKTVSLAKVVNVKQAQQQQQRDEEDALARQEAEFRRHQEEQEALRKEEAQAQQAAQQLQATQNPQIDPLTGERVKNWPPFPKWCIRPFRPFWYHNIKEEIPAQHRALVRGLYFCWIFTICCLVWNFIALLAGFGASAYSSAGSSWGISILYLFLFVPMSFLCWYKIVYNALKKNKSINFMIFFFVFFMQFVSCVINAVGIPGGGAAGWIVAFSALSKNTGVAICVLIGALMWTVNALVCLLLFKQVHNLYRGSVPQHQLAGEVAAAAYDNEAVRAGVTDSIMKNAQDV